MRVLVIALSFLLFAPTGAQGRTETCAHDSLGLKQTPGLEKIKDYFGAEYVGFVNETEGSYVIIDFMKGPMKIAFFTSGLFDLVPIKSEGPLEICDDGVSLHMRALGREEELRIQNGKLVFSEGGPKKTFAKGSMPSKLAKLHHFSEHSLASEH